MLFQLPISALLLALAVLSEASSHGHGAHLAHLRRRPLNPRGPQPIVEPSKRSLSRRSCKAKSSSAAAAATTLATSSTKAPSTTSTTKQEAETTSTEKAAETTSTEKAAKTTSTEKATTTTEASSSSNTNAVAAGNFKPVKPSDWPTATQAGPVPTSTVASASDPYLEELSKAIDNSGNSLFTQVHTGDMTYYGQGLGACGDVYDDNSFTAAVSHLMYDAWPGANGDAENRNPICGPFVPGRQALNSQGVMTTAVKSSISGFAEIGGDGLINCVGSVDAVCHVPLTATVTHGDKSIQVKIVDRCAACAEGDIDLTPAAFAALADMSLGRTSVSWQFNPW